MEFIPLYCKENLLIVNPEGFVGVVTLWSKKETIYQKFLAAGIDLNAQSSPIAAFGNLYGNGLKFLLVNLLYNPQIRYLVICGNSRNYSSTELQNFFSKGIEKSEDLGIVRNKIVGTEKTLDDCLTRDLFKLPPNIKDLGDPHTEGFAQNLRSFLSSISNDNIFSQDYERIKIELPEIKIKYFPSNPRGLTVCKQTPLEAWKELIFCLNRFGHFTDMGPEKGKRIELQNVKVVVEKPEEDQDKLLRKYGFSISLFRAYQQSMLSREKREDEEYTYGNRIRAYFGVDGLTEVVDRLKKNSNDRRCYLSLWDTSKDVTSDAKGHPCLVSLYFKVFDNKLTLSVVFRVHNAIDAWLQNFYGLMSLHKYVSEKTGLMRGPITIVSQSISINPADYDRIIGVIHEKEKKFEFEPDPHGQFRFSIEDGLIVVRHIYNGEVIGEYKSKKVERIQYELKRDHAISDIGHAIYVGRQLAKAERCLKTGEKFTEFMDRL